MGRSIAYRFGRSMYLHARGDFSNDMSSNGEMLIQDCVLAAWKKQPIKAANLVVFDVGANIGDWSKALLQQAKAHEIDAHLDLFSFEPVPSTAKTLRNNLTSNDPRLHIEQVALSSSVGSAEIYVVADDAGTNSLHADPRAARQTPVVISLTTAFSFCDSKGIGHVQLLKCDTEGHDMEVIRGALPLLEQGRISVLQFEYNHRWALSRNFLRDVFLATENLPYNVTKLQPDHLLMFEDWHPELEKFFEGNYALIHNDALAWFPIKNTGFNAHNVLSIK